MGNNIKKYTGFTLIEAVVVIGVLGVVIMSILTMFNSSVRNSAAARARLVAVTLATQEMEKIRNLDYKKVCIGGGDCIINNDQIFEKGGIKYTVTIAVNKVDDAFDGCGSTYSGDPTDCQDKPSFDSEDEDYRKIGVTVTWDKFYNNSPVALSTLVVPKGLEVQEGKGSLSIKVFNSNGDGVPQAKVTVGKVCDGCLTADYYTDSAGNLQVLNLDEADYRIIATKENYSTDQTYAQTETFMPVNPDKTVVAGQITEASFSIDQFSTLKVYTLKTDCSNQNQMPNDKIDLKLEGEKIIGYEDKTPILKNSKLLSTTYGNPYKLVDNLEWDNYSLSITGSTYSNPKADVNGDTNVSELDVYYLIDYLFRGSGKPPVDDTGDLNGDGIVDISDVMLIIDLINGITPNFDIAGIISPSSLNILPGTAPEVQLILEEHTTNSLLVTVKDSGTGYTVDEASINLSSTSPAYDQTKKTSRNLFEQTDWSHGPTNNDLFKYDPLAFASWDSNIDYTTKADYVTLKQQSQTISIPQSTTDDFFANITRNDQSHTTADWSSGKVQLKENDEDLGFQQQQAQKFKLAASGVPVPTIEYITPGTAQTNKLNPSGQGNITRATLTVKDPSLPAGTSMQYFLTDDGINYDSVTSGIYFTFPTAHPGSDLRFKAILATTNTSRTPVLNNIQIDYDVASYVSSGYLISSTFDTTNNIGTNYYNLSWDPVQQITGTEVKFQIATSTVDDPSSWEFLGPAGAGSYYTSPAIINSTHKDQRYLRYKLILSTQDVNNTPMVHNVNMEYNIGCSPPGQAFFKNITQADYTLQVAHQNYNDYSVIIKNISGYNQKDVKMIKK